MYQIAYEVHGEGSGIIAVEVKPKRSGGYRVLVEPLTGPFAKPPPGTPMRPFRDGPPPVRER